MTHYANTICRKFIQTLIVLMVTTGSLWAQNLDEDRIRDLIREEIERFVSTEGALDEAIERGIGAYIVNQRVAAEEAKAQKQLERVKFLRPIEPERDHIYGDPDAPITIVEYSDFECPFCKRFHPTVVKLMENNKENLRWVYRHFPLGFHNPGAQKQAEASECAAKIGGNDAFWEYSDKIYTRTKSNGKGFPVENLRPLADEIGLDGDAFSACLDSGEMTARVQEDIENGRALGITGTPAAFIINDKGGSRFVAGALPLQTLQAMVDKLAE